GMSHITAEINDLLQRIGRIAYQNPAWTPAAADASLPRNPADLAPTLGDMCNVLAAVHRTTDALARIAATDSWRVSQAEADGRLYIATRLLPAQYDIPYRYTPAPHSRTEPLLNSYDHVTSACSSATADLDHLAEATRAPTQTLAIARRLPAGSQSLPDH